MDNVYTDDMKEFISEVESINLRYSNNGPFVFAREKSWMLSEIDCLLARFYQQDKLNHRLIPSLEMDNNTISLRLSTQDGIMIENIYPYFTKPARVLNG